MIPRHRTRVFVLLIGLLAGAGRVASASSSLAAPADSLASGLDFSGFQRLLDEYLKVTSPPGAPLETRFDYVRLRKSADAGQRFVRIRQQLFGFSPTRLDDRARRAWAINAYNYLVIETATQNIWESTQRAQRQGKRIYYSMQVATVQTIALEDGSFFEGSVVEIDGAKYSLNAFERHFVFCDFDLSSAQPPPACVDPRAHFALVCAAKGCPPLEPRCYRPDSLERQLEAATRQALRAPSQLRWNTTTDRLEASSIFNWYAGDFGGRDPAFAFLKKYAPAGMREQIERRKLPWIPAFILWDWGLNHIEDGGKSSAIQR